MPAPAPFTYPETGATRQGPPLPDGYHHLRVTTVVGTGPADFRAAAEAVLTWRMHRAVGVRIDSTAERAAPGVEVTVGLGPVRAPCRVVWAELGPDTAGFAYGTLPGHPERGEEAFLVTLAESGQVALTITAFSRPAAWYTGLVPPLTRALQRAYARRCGRSLRAVLASRT
ncbi:DUF1990 family protein [Streptomyces monticola]|uniref:DUF1990 family protein n=1 Tax=Streptomyces monticola TaxID=2666263 RepID=A0ABW2JP07_9ACTN